MSGPGVGWGKRGLYFGTAEPQTKLAWLVRIAV
jgi:hypothetical protein